ncbi:hypothetical protein BDR05DRAFT_963566 [Suillus weaverae]|nr:hypothetical protein BDR05DRAFT_963566 [Suillus weaverae]
MHAQPTTRIHKRIVATSPNNICPPHHPPAGFHYGGPHPHRTNSTPSWQLADMGQHPLQSAQQQAFSYLPCSSDDHP